MIEEKEKKPKDSSIQKKDLQDSNKNQDIIPEEILEAIPEEDRGRVASIIKQTMISGVMKRNNPIADKVTSKPYYATYYFLRRARFKRP